MPPNPIKFHLKFYTETHMAGVNLLQLVTTPAPLTRESVSVTCTSHTGRERRGRERGKEGLCSSGGPRETKERDALVWEWQLTRKEKCIRKTDKDGNDG